MTGLTLRLLCAKTLLRIEKGGSYGNLALNAALKDSTLGVRDKQLCTALFQGTLERRITLDACIAAHSKRPPARLDAEVRTVLRCGICELMTLGTQEAAAVNLWTECVKALHKTSAAGMVNAVLRGFLRSGKQIPVPEDPLAAMSVRYSVPEPLVRQLTDDYGSEAAEAFFADSLGEPPLYLRRNPLRCTAEQLAAECEVTAVPEVENAYRVTRGGQNAFLRSEAFTQGFFHIQDLASQLCCLALDPQPDETVLDVCAAPGGKSFTIAERMENRGQVLACDLHENRVKLIAEGAKRLGLSCITAQTGDAARPAPDRPMADRILCDVPCSGFGVIRRKPEIRYKSLDETAGLPAVQLAILEASAQSLKAGGVLVYSTCTLCKAENEDVVTAFLAAHPEFTLEKPWQGIPALAGYAQEMTTLFPAQLGSDGFFIAKMRRAAAE